MYTHSHTHVHPLTHACTPTHTGTQSHTRTHEIFLPPPPPSTFSQNLFTSSFAMKKGTVNGTKMEAEGPPAAASVGSEMEWFEIAAVGE